MKPTSLVKIKKDIRKFQKVFADVMDYVQRNGEKKYLTQINTILQDMSSGCPRCVGYDNDTEVRSLYCKRDKLLTLEEEYSQEFWAMWARFEVNKIIDKVKMNEEYGF